MFLKNFEKLMQTMADGWNEGNPAKSVDCFTDNAIYTEPPDKQFIQGKAELYGYFGGSSAKPGNMKMLWHNLFFNEGKQMGGREYTFEMNNIIRHGVAIIELENGKIKLWREYDTTSNLSYNDFVKVEGKDLNLQ